MMFAVGLEKGNIPSRSLFRQNWNCSRTRVFNALAVFAKSVITPRHRTLLAISLSGFYALLLISSQNIDLTPARYRGHNNDCYERKSL